METVLRVTLVYFFVLISMRVMGKRELAQLSPFELVLLMLIPDIAQQGMMRQDFSITNSIIGLSTIFGLVFINGVVTYLSRRASKVVEGKPVVIFREGVFFTEAMDKERISAGEVISSMHRSGIESLDQVKWVIVEPDGDMTFIPRGPIQHGPQSASDKDMLIA